MHKPLAHLPILLLTASLAHASAALAQDNAPEEIPFAGGVIANTPTPDGEKIVTFGGEEIGRDFQAWFERTATVAGTEVALISLGAGGNACGPYTLIVWPDESGAVRADTLGDDCTQPAPAVSDYAIQFVPYLGPGESLPAYSWTPEEGFRVAGMLQFVPQPGTGWDDLAADPGLHPERYLSNEALYDYATEIIGGELRQYATGLQTASDMEKIGDGIYAGSGCVAHDCGSANSLIVVDFNANKAWFAQFREGKIAQWPAPDMWPAVARDALEQFSSL
ncbi:MAG: hypothetical protein WAU86_19660 [Oricola sp.]